MPALAEFVARQPHSLSDEVKTDLARVDIEKRLIHGQPCTAEMYTVLRLIPAELDALILAETRSYREELIADRFVLLGLLGEGAFGCVHRAFDRNPTSLLDQREVALKIAKPLVGALMPASFLAEARAAATLRHPNILHLYDSGKDAADRPWLAMEPIRGGTTLETLKSAATQPSEATATHSIA